MVEIEADAEKLRTIADAMGPGDMVTVRMSPQTAALVQVWGDYQRALTSMREGYGA